MKYIYALLLVLIFSFSPCFSNEGIRVINPHEGARVEVILRARAKEFGGNIDVIKGNFAKAEDFEVVLCDSKGKEYKRSKVDEGGNYNFLDVDSGKWYLKFDSDVKPPENKPEVKKIAPGSIIDMPYIQKN